MDFGATSICRWILLTPTGALIVTVVYYRYFLRFWAFLPIHLVYLFENWMQINNNWPWTSFSLFSLFFSLFLSFFFLLLRFSLYFSPFLPLSLVFSLFSLFFSLFSLFFSIFLSFSLFFSFFLFFSLFSLSISLFFLSFLFYLPLFLSFSLLFIYLWNPWYLSMISMRFMLSWIS